MTMTSTERRELTRPRVAESEGLYARALGLIPAQTQTLAKGPGQHVRGFAPKYLRRGKGSRVWDADGNEFLDMTMAVGPLVLGYGHPEVDASIRRQLDDGITFSLMHPLEVEVAESIQACIPTIESVRFSKTGADVTSAAVRLARAFTGRSKVLCCGYHGWHDWYISVTDRNRGVPSPIQDLTFTIPHDSIGAIERSLDADTACVILEPVVFAEPSNGYLQALVDRAHANGTLVVFDEMWTGFRIALGGAQERYGVAADLVTYSKAIANGMPLSVLAGRPDVMSLLEHEVFFFTTFGGEALSLAAAKTTIDVLKRDGVPAILEERGREVMEGYNSIASGLGIKQFTWCSGLPARTIVTFDSSAGNPLEMKSLVQQELIRRGVLWSGFHNMSLAHSTQDVEQLLGEYEEVLPILKEAVETETVRERLEGEPVEPVFRRTSNFNMRPRAA